MGEGGNAVQDSAVQTTSLENIEALLEAARYDDMDDTVSLASAGVSLNSKDSQGRTVVNLNDLNATNEEMNTPLHWACLNGHVEVVRKLIFAGANLSVLNSYERTPIDEAVTRGKMDVLDAINAAAAQVELTGVSVS
ncbi:ankyrin repeat family protein [Prunus dulcis]|uniref:Ankyrin repeat family protein n=1 Tax=Prunus dulcis TaxID=3755 RepID=A0A4Y1RDS4_PRUDU|nr:ankyrin repeat family protein [Prunus dulcis]